MPLRNRLPGVVRRDGISVGSLLFEVVAIVLGVLLALAVDEWREGRRDRQNVQAALQLIQAELTRNQRWLQRNVAYYEAIVDTLDGIVGRTGPGAAGPIPGWRGLQPALLSDGSYRAAIATQAFADMDLEVASALATVYSFQDLYKSLLDKAITAMIENEGGPVELRQMLRNLAQIGAELAAAYGQVLERLDDART